MGKTTIDRLIINSPYEEARRHWRYDRETRTFDLVEGHRWAGCVVASPDSRAFDDPGIFVEIPLVKQIRPRAKAWREAGYPGVTGVTRRLLEHWTDPENFEWRRFFFCQVGELLYTALGPIAHGAVGTLFFLFEGGWESSTREYQGVYENATQRRYVSCQASVGRADRSRPNRSSCGEPCPVFRKQPLLVEPSLVRLQLGRHALSPLYPMPPL